MAVAKVQYMKKTKEQKDQCRVTTPKGRLSYPFIFEPAEGDDGKKKYRCQLLVPKQNKRGEDLDYKEVHTAIRNCKKIVYGADKSKWPRNLQSPIRDGDTDEGFKVEKKSKKTGKMILVTKPEYKGMWVISASSNEQSKPAVFDINEEPIESPADVYPGCYARLALMAQEWTWKKKQGIMFVLDGVLKLADGEPFGDKKDTKDMFKKPLSDDDLEDIESDDEDEDLDDEDDAPKAKKKKRPVDDEDEDDADEDSDDSDDEEDSDEDSDDEDADDSDDDDEPPPKKKKATTKKKRPVDDDEDDE